jgi:hypothetical protein
LFGLEMAETAASETSVAPVEARKKPKADKKSTRTTVKQKSKSPAVVRTKPARKPGRKTASQPS